MYALNESSNGKWNSKDFSYTQSYGTYEEKLEANLEEIKTRLKNLGIDGWLILSAKKLAVNWSNGDYDCISKVDSPNEVSKLYEYIAGNKKIFLLYYLQILKTTILIIFLMAIISEYNCTRSDKNNDNNYKFICISVFGMFMFYLLWEVASRYSLTCLPWMMLAIPKGIAMIEEKLKISTIEIQYEQTQDEKRQINAKKMLIYIVLAIILITVILLGINFKKYCVEKRNYRDIVISQTGLNGEGSLTDIANKQIEQEFIANRKFDCIAIRFFRNKDGQDGVYYFILLDENNNELVRQELDSSDIQKSGYVTFKFDSIIPDGNKKYIIKIYPKDNIKQSSIGISSYKNTRTYDLYENGTLKVDGKERNEDMTFKVQNENKRPYVSKKIYVGISLLIIILEIYACYPYIKRVGERKKDEQ